LSPSSLKQRARKEDSIIIGRDGGNLSAYVHEHKDKIHFIVEKIKTAYPHFNSLDSIDFPNDEVVLCVNEQMGNGNIQHLVQSVHINDGMMRMIGMFAAMTEQTTFLLFDEIENGINQELVKFLLEQLVEAKQQIVVTTHSPLFLNYLDDDLARNSVHYFYKTPEGFTRCRKFFSLPSTSKKLGALGPGEAIADTDLYRLNEEIERLNCNKEN
jgi:predicted ATPase